uniref:Uncharacterized protein n=1 Tax=Strongyloides venezuelensis TaxID=75913 RepID=A0A0K0FJ02_STRVS
MDSLIIFDHAKQIAENTEKEINLFFKDNYLNNKQIEGVNRMIMNIFKTSENLEEIDLPLAPVPSSRPKMKGEQNIAYSINLKKVSKNNKYWWYNRRHESS